MSYRPAPSPNATTTSAAKPFHCEPPRRASDRRHLSAASELSAIVDRGQAAFNTDPILRRATERLLEIIGEATNQLSSETINHYPEVPWRDISRLRIVLAHHYHRVDPDHLCVIAGLRVCVTIHLRLQDGGSKCSENGKHAHFSAE